MYDIFTSGQTDVVMVGNSLTCNVNWSEILNRRNIANRGIASNITSGDLHRLGYVYRLSPKICFIEGGVNDLYSNHSVKNIIRNFISIVDSLRLDDSIPVIQMLNNGLSEFALKGAVEFSNINALVSKNGFSSRRSNL